MNNIDYHNISDEIKVQVMRSLATGFERAFQKVLTSGEKYAISPTGMMTNPSASDAACIKNYHEYISRPHSVDSIPYKVAEQIKKEVEFLLQKSDANHSLLESLSRRIIFFGRLLKSRSKIL